MNPKPDFHICTRRRLLGAALLVGGGTAGLTRVALADAGREPIQQPPNPTAESFIARAFEMRDLAIKNGDQGYGAVVVSASGEIVGQAPSRVVTNLDPTAHAEMEAIRDAARRLSDRDLANHVMYSSSRPCPMCEAAAYWANLSTMIYGKQSADAGGPKLCR